MSELDSNAIRLGLMPPLTGVVALYGQEIRWAGQIARDEVNAAGGVLGRPLELVVEDDGSLPETAVPAAERLLDQHGCVALIGNLLSSARIAVASQVAMPRRVPYLNFSFYEGSIHNRYFFHFAALPNQQIDRMIPYMARAAGPKMFFAGNNYEWPRGSIDAARRALSACGGELVGEEYLPLGSARVDDLLGRVQCSGADVFVPYFAGEDQIRLLTRFSQRGLKRHMAVVMGHYDEAMAARLRPEVRAGFLACNSYFMSLDTPGNRRYLSALAALPEVDGIWPHGRGVLTHFGEAVYLCVHAFAKAANQAGSLAAEALVAELERIEVEGPQGLVRMDPTTHHAHVNVYLARCDVEGSFELVESFGCLPPRIPERYRHVPDVPPAPEARRAGAAMHEPFSVAVAGIDGDGRVEHVNRAFLRLLGLEDESAVLGAPIACLMVDPGVLEGVARAMESRSEWHGSLSVRLPDGGQRPLTVIVEPMRRADGGKPGYTISCLDAQGVPIGARAATQQILAMVDVGVLAVSPDGLIVEANRRAGEMFGYAIDELLGLSVQELIPPQFRQAHARHMDAFLRGAARERRVGVRPALSGYRRDGSTFALEVSLSKVMIESGWIIVATMLDITERKVAEDELVWRAIHDPLTGLPNRVMILERLNQALLRSARLGHGVAVLFIDLDGFKLINDSHGHQIGDELLKTIARRLLEHVRPGDTVGRLGGDEFIVLCDQVDTSAAIVKLAERLNELLREPLDLAGHRLFATASIGLAMGHGSTHSAEDMLRNADAAMYQAKEQGRDGWRFFTEEIHAQARRRLDITNGLRQAIEREEFQIRFQPILCVESRLIRGAELLLRWTTPEGEASPAHFIPIAETSGSIVPIGKWVFRQACLAEQRWRSECGEQAPYVSVNVSARQLNDDSLVESFRAMLAETRADPRRIVLELTETSLMSDVVFSLRVLRQLADLGLRVAVDDFGTGYSSLAQLLRLPLNALKIDREFVDGLDKRHDSRAIVKAVCGMARAMGLQVIAEGVENDRQFAYLRDLGCDYVQGFYFHRPMPPDDFLALLRESRASGWVATAADDLYTLLYVSLATRPMSGRELRDMVEAARESNRAQGITGFLLYLNGSFMQILEGSRPRIESLMERIRRDARHHRLRVVIEGPIAKRAFLDWSMGLRDMDHVGDGQAFDERRERTLSFVDMAEDPRACYGFISAFAG